MIRRAGRVEMAPLGFGVPSERRPAPTMLCLVRLGRDQLKKADENTGADVVIVSDVEPEKLGDALKRLGNVPVGMRLDSARREAVTAARGAGADFVLLDERSSAEALAEEKIGLVLRIGPDLSDAELRALASLPLDAVEVPPLEEPFSVRRALELRRLALLCQTPLLVEVAPDVTAARLQALRDAGAAGVVLDGKHADRLAGLRESVLSLPARGRRREERGEALLPSLTAVPTGEEDEPDYE